MINKKYRVWIMSILVIIITVLISVFVIEKQSTKTQNNKTKEMQILKEIFKDSSIVSQKNGQYEVEGDNKTESDVLGETSVRKKMVNINLLETDSNNDGRNEIIAFTTIIFLGPVCTSCRARFYIDVLEVLSDGYTIKNEQEFKGFDDNLFNSDIMVKKVESVDINNDTAEEIQILYQSDSYFRLDKEKIALLQWQGNQFKVIWQQIIHINMDEYGSLPEEDKQNFDATFSFEKSKSEYPDIMVKKTLLKDKGVQLVTPRKEEFIYKWNTEKKEYYLWQKEKIGEEKPELSR